MKWMIASDLHGSAYCCRLLLERLRAEGADRLLLLGDLLYHGPRNALPQEYDCPAVSAMLNSVKEKILAVRGNCDCEVDQMVLEFPIMADYVLAEAEGLSLFVTHGHLWHEDCLPPMAPGTILLHGHTHVPIVCPHEGYTYINPGSVSIPKADSWQGYMTLEGGLFQWKDLTGQVRQEYRAH